MPLKRTGLMTSALALAFAGPAFADTPNEPSPMTNVTIDYELLNTVADSLPESRQVDAAFLDPVYDPNLYFNSDTQVSVTFISEGAGYKNSLGYFNYDQGAFDDVSFGQIDTNNSGNITARELEDFAGINDVGIVFGNASGSGGFAGNGGSLETGNTYVLGGGSYTERSDGSWLMENGTVYDQDTSMGFFVSANSWKGGEVRGWDTDHDNPTYYSVDMLNPENGSGATLDNVSAYARHTAMLNVEGQNQVLLGFEDLRRPYGDNDFNDAVFILRTTPEDAFEQGNIASVTPTPTDPETGARIASNVSAAPAPDIGALGGIAIAGLAFFGLHRRKTKKQHSE